MATLSVGGTTVFDGATLQAASLTSATFPAGHILQVLDSKKTDTSSVNNNAWTDIGGTDQNGGGSIWCCKITPKSTSSKILVCAGVVIGKKNGNNSASLLFLRNSTSIFKGDAAGSRTQTWNFGYGNSNIWGTQASVQFLDSPSTLSEVTYKLQHRSEGSSYYSYINRSHSDSDAADNGYRAASVITLMEVAG